MKVSYHTFLFINSIDIPIGDGNKKVESWLHLFAQSIESIKSWSDDYDVDIFVFHNQRPDFTSEGKRQESLDFFRSFCFVGVN